VKLHQRIAGITLQRRVQERRLGSTHGASADISACRRERSEWRFGVGLRRLGVARGALGAATDLPIGTARVVWRSASRLMDLTTRVTPRTTRPNAGANK
jgi:hypothetical protein